MSTDPFSPDLVSRDTATQQLLAFRQLLVGERRRVVQACFEAREQRGSTAPGGGTGYAADVLQLQAEIEAVDRAIKDEESLAASLGDGARSVRNQAVIDGLRERPSDAQH